MSVSRRRLRELRQAAKVQRITPRLRWYCAWERARGGYHPSLSTHPDAERARVAARSILFDFAIIDPLTIPMRDRVSS